MAPVKETPEKILPTFSKAVEFIAAHGAGDSRQINRPGTRLADGV
jgi:hypothetical protein